MQLNDYQIVIGDSKGKSLYRKNFIFINKIIPNRVVENKNVFEITHLDKIYHLDGFKICTENDKVINVGLFGFHPNCDPDTDIFCLPDFKKGVPLTADYLNLILTNIETYYLDNCFFNPTGKQLRYRKLQSMYVQLNK